MNSINPFALVSNSQIIIDLDGADLSSDTGFLLFQELNRSSMANSCIREVQHGNYTHRILIPAGILDLHGVPMYTN